VEDNLFSSEARKNDRLTLLTRTDVLNWDQWERLVETALDIFERNELKKLVLASKSVLKFDRQLNPIELLADLVQEHATSFHFCFQINNESAFLGLSPERLYRRNQKSILSEAVAGTRARGEDEHQDSLLGEELLKSEKDLREHRWVIDSITSNLKPLCRSIKYLSREKLLKLPHVQHLETQILGEMKNSISDGEIISLLHPTPAVGGYPKDVSIEKIAELEPFDRGWYAGPVGWLGRGEAEFVVAIRSAMIAGRELSLFAGSGLVSGSNASKEWQENENKLLTFTKMFHEGESGRIE